MPRERKKQNREEIPSDNEMYGLEDEDDGLFDDSQKGNEAFSDEEVYGFGGSDEAEDDEGADEKNDDDFDMGSDIEEEDDGLPDDRAWGKSSRRFYNTDYVDQDYEGFYQGKEAEEAELEEQEARQIQRRLAEQLNEADFVIAEPVDSQTTTDNDAIEVIEQNLSKLTARQKLDLLKKESPEFFVLIDDFKNKLLEMEQIVPLLNYFHKRGDPTPAVQFLQKKYLILINYCTNISFYLLLKSKRLPIKNHPILKSLYQYRKLLEQVHHVDEMMKPQIEKLLETVKSGGEPEVLHKDDFQMGKAEKKILKLLSKAKSKSIKKNEKAQDNTQSSKDNRTIDDEDDDDDYDDDIEANDKDTTINEDEEESDIIKETDKKRAITYEMAKNKGLMPKRNKAQRNPRVKHRQKYRKALIRRRGQVRMARKEIPVYGGEPTGIKVGITKSIKFK